jgi:hypothetical protein
MQLAPSYFHFLHMGWLTDLDGLWLRRRDYVKNYLPLGDKTFSLIITNTVSYELFGIKTLLTISSCHRREKILLLSMNCKLKSIRICTFSPTSVTTDLEFPSFFVFPNASYMYSTLVTDDTEMPTNQS